MAKTGRRLKLAALRKDSARGILYPVEQRASDVLSFSVAEGITGPADMCARDRPDGLEFFGHWWAKPKLPEDAPHGRMDDVDQEIADYMGRGGIIKLGRGIAKTTAICVTGKKCHRMR